MLPWSRPIYHTNLVANAGEGRESNWAAKIQHLIFNAQAQISTAPFISLGRHNSRHCHALLSTLTLTPLTYALRPL